MIIIPVAAIVLVFGVATWGLVMDWRDEREAGRLAAMEAAKRQAREAREADPVALTAREERLFAEIAGQIKAEIGRGTA